MNYPGIILSKGINQKTAIKAIQNRLNELGLGSLEVDGIFGDKTSASVKLFQAQFDDALGNRLIIDGKVGPVTWATLFEQVTPPTEHITTDYAQRTLAFAVSQIGVMEDPLGSNRGTQVEKYLASTNLGGGHPWCMAFVYWCSEKAAIELNTTNQLYKTAHVLTQWNKTPTQNKLSKEVAMARLELIKVGSIFIMDYGKNAGHTGFVESINGNLLTTIEGNTNVGGSREGIGVFRRTNRAVREINKGFILL
jgi:peptidoglycan hydrolase-like protein with peptidoglycan-binding domain